MALQIDFSSAESIREELTEEQKKRIEELYKEASEKVAQEAEKLSQRDNISSILRVQYLNELKKQIDRELAVIQSQLGSEIRSNMEDVVAGVIADNSEWIKSLGLPVGMEFSHVQGDIVNSVLSGQIYEGNWSLSRALWQNTTKARSDIQTVIAQGIAQNKSAYDIAKDLEKYLNPDAKKEWDWSKVYPGTNKKVDYNAQRLARTMVSHAYQQAFVRTTQKNPFVTKYQWLASNSERVCEICEERDGQLFDKDDLPMDHPNGMCTFVAVIDDSMEEIADRLADWALGGEDSALDEWAKDLYGKDWEQKKEEVQAKT